MPLPSLLILNLTSLFSFLFVYASVHTGSIFQYIDLYISLHVPIIWSDIGNLIVTSITYATRPLAGTVLLIILILAFAKKNKWRIAALLTVALPTAIYSSKLLKLMVDRTRPTGGLIAVDGLAFPSTHATVGGLFAGGCILIYQSALAEWKKKTSYLAVGITALFLGISRIYLGIHWSSDVIAGYLLGFFWATFFIIIYTLSRSGGEE